MVSNRLSHATWRTVAPIAILTVSLVALLAWSAFMVRNAMLRNAEMLGTQLARTYAAEEEAHINAFRLLLGYGRASVTSRARCLSAASWETASPLPISTTSR